MKPLDLRIGEARSLCKEACRLYDLNNIAQSFSNEDWEYSAKGEDKLTQLLEERYGAPVIITNGANHALHVALSVLKKRGFYNLGFRNPYWNRIPEIAEYLDLGYSDFEGDQILQTPQSKVDSRVDSYLLTLPNNPDGFIPNVETVRMAHNFCKDQKLPLIHDAAYYTRTYLSVDYPIEPIGDIQIFSASKMWGLSSLRIGWIVVHNMDYYDDLADVVELTTVGTAIASQRIVYNILKREQEVPQLKEEFEKYSRIELEKARALIRSLKPNLVEVPAATNSCGHFSGMFAWIKPRKMSYITDSKIEVLPGSIFGKTGFVRINLAAGYDLIAEAVKRINSCV